MIKVIPPKAGVAPTTRLALLDRVPSANANKPTFQLMLLRTLSDAGEYGRARKVAMALVSNRNVDPDMQAAARRELAWALYELRNYGELLKLLDQLLQAEPNDANMVDLLAHVHLAVQDYDAALAVALRGVSLAPGNPNIFMTFACAAGAKDCFGMLFDEARRAIDKGYRNAGVLAAFLQAGLAVRSNEATDLADETIACITPVAANGHAVLNAMDHELIYREIIESADLIDAPRVYSSQNSKRLKLDGGGVTDYVLNLFEAAAEIAKLTAEKLHPKSLIANNSPDTVSVSAWATVYGTDGRETSHVHPDGWFSGVYYPAAKDMADISGSLYFGFPPLGKHPTDADVVVKIDPQPGQLVLFPSHLPHWTAAPLRAQKRVSLAFDLKPAVNA